MRFVDLGKFQFSDVLLVIFGRFGMVIKTLWKSIFVEKYLGAALVQFKDMGLKFWEAFDSHSIVRARL